MRKMILGAVVLASAVGFGQAAYADSDKMEKPMLSGVGMKHLSTALHLDAAQKAKIKMIKENFKASQKDNWTALKSIRVKIREQVQSDKMDEAAVDKLIDERVSLLRTMFKAGVLARHQIYETLNAQQKLQLQEMHKKVEKKMMERHEK